MESQMALSKDLLDKLVCPTCKSKMQYEESKDKLICQHCSVAYKVNNDVPVLLADEAEKI